MINQEPIVNWEHLQHRIDACRSMSEADKKHEALDMLRELAREILEK